MSKNNGIVSDLLNSFMKADKNTIAFSISKGENIEDITYHQFVDDILKKAALLRDNNVIGKHVALIGVNGYDWVVTFFSLAITKNVMVLLNQMLPEDMLQAQCEKADVSIVIGDSDIIDNLKKCDFSCEYYKFDEIKGYSEEVTLDSFDFNRPHDDTMILIFTSGTTGKSKAVEITVSNFKHSIVAMDKVFDSEYRDCTISTLPRYHIAGLIELIGLLNNHKKLCIGRGLKYLILDIPVFNPTYMALVPAMVENLLKLLKITSTEEGRKKILGNNLKKITVAGANLKKETAEAMLNMGFVLESTYAMSETTGNGTWGALDSNRTNTVGKVYGDAEFAIEDGEIVIKGPYNMKGYYKEPEETAKVLIDGWMHTGDLGYFDEEGYLYITGRKKNIIILPNGENVSPEEVEEVLYRNNIILECMVYNEKKGICADIYTEKPELAKKAVRAYNETVPKYRQIYKVNYFDTPLEKTGSGKIKRKENVYV